MPSYRALEPGFFGGTSYGPNTKREIVTTEKPLKPVPSWLELIVEKKETAAERTAREAAELKALTDKKAADNADVKGASFMDGVKGAIKSAVETLT